MEHENQECSVISKPLALQRNENSEGIHINSNSKDDTAVTKSVTYNLPKDNMVLAPCVVRLENMNVCNSTCKSSNTPKVVQKSIPLEPITPKANIEFSLELKKAINERNILTSKTKKQVFEALDEIKNRTEEERRNYKKESALLEIVTSEIKYIHQLEIIINFFMKPTKERKLLKPEDYDILFRNIIPIYNINKELLNELHKGIENIPRAFSKIAPFMKLYSVYASEFTNKLKVLQNARSLYPHFAKLVEDQETRPEVQNKLSALLIAPIQRVPRYKLLLTNLYNLTKPSEKGFDTLSDSLKKIEDVAEHINRVVSDQENTQRLLEFQRCLHGGPNIITPGRILIKEGILTKMSTKNSSNEKLYVVLMNDIILFCKMKKEEPKVDSLRCTCIYPLSKCKIVEILDKGCMKIVCQEEESILYHCRLNVTKEWIDIIKATIDEHLNDRKTLRKESSARRPVKRKDLNEYNEIGLSPGRPLKKRKFDEDPVVPTNCHIHYRIVKRRPIRDLSKSYLENYSEPDSSSIHPEPSTSTANDDTTNKVKDEQAVDVFVFGKQHNEEGSRLFKFFGGVGSSIKRLFGFRN